MKAIRRSLSTCFEATRMCRSIERASLEKKPLDQIEPGAATVNLSRMLLPKLLPKLLPNSVARADTKRHEERLRTPKTATQNGFTASNDTSRDGSNRTRRSRLAVKRHTLSGP
jgi:hypothetical protein